jgi:predicted transposase YbfD/YdcC
LGAIFSLLTCALLCGARSLTAVADWGRDHCGPLTAALGFTRPQTPCGSTLHNLLQKLDWTALERPLRQWTQAVLATLPELEEPEVSPAPEGIAIDGKTLRGALQLDAEVVALVSAVGHRLGLTLGAVEISDADEIGAVETLLEKLVLTGKVVTLDALHTQRKTAQLILAGGGHYVMAVKGNQPQLEAAIRTQLAPAAGDAADRASVEESNRGHGRLETRALVAVRVAADTLDWPGAAQVFRLERCAWRGPKNERAEETLYGVTSLPRAAAGPAQLLGYVRGHWSIENRSHWVRDVTFGEDASLLRTGKLPQTLALFRMVVLNCLRRTGARNIARETRRLAARPWDCLRHLGLLPDN